MDINQANEISKLEAAWRAYDEGQQASSFGGAGMAPSRQGGGVWGSAGSPMPTSPRPTADQIQQSYLLRESLGLIPRDKSMLGTLGEGLKGIGPEVGQVGTNFVLPAVAGYYGTQALGGMLGPSGVTGAAGSTTLAGGAGADTLGASGGIGLGGASGTAGSNAVASGAGLTGTGTAGVGLGGVATGVPTAAVGTGAAAGGGGVGATLGTGGINPFASQVGPSTVGGAASTAGKAGGGMFDWLNAGNVKSALGVIPSIAEYFSSRDAGNTMERATDEAARRADPFASERPAYMMMLREMMTNPNYMMQDPSYNFRVRQGQDALERSNAARGYLGSGNMNLDLTRYGQDMGSQEYEKQFGRLSSLAGVNAGSPAAAGQAYGQGMTNVAGQNQQTSGSLWNAARNIYNIPAVNKGVNNQIDKIFGSSA
jgi:hypothetical protein